MRAPLVKIPALNARTILFREGEGGKVDSDFRQVGEAEIGRSASGKTFRGEVCDEFARSVPVPLDGQSNRSAWHDYLQIQHFLVPHVARDRQRTAPYFSENYEPETRNAKSGCTGRSIDALNLAASFTKSADIWTPPDTSSSSLTSCSMVSATRVVSLTTPIRLSLNNVRRSTAVASGSFDRMPVEVQ